ncbi:MAG: CoA pyrophosphatase [Myxococcales bacterium]|nr:CoA pyrophosphatase [Myxococcales bacterium]
MAALVRGAGDEAEVLLMRRPVSNGDRWSGQVCLPGGKAEEQDINSVATARRETHEELGVQLEHCGQYVGTLDDVQAIARGQLLTTVITPHIFTQVHEPQIVLSAEAAHAFWLPLGPAARGEYDSSYQYGSGVRTLALPCWRYEEEVVWGLTHKMLHALLVLAGVGE